MALRGVSGGADGSVREHKRELHDREAQQVVWLDGARGQAVWGWVVTHTLRFLLPRPHWLRLYPAQAQLPALRSFTKWLDVLQGLLLASTFNLFFFVAGAAAFMTLAHRRDATTNRVWSLLFHKFVRYATLLCVGCVAALPVVGIMMWHRELSPTGLSLDDYASMLLKAISTGGGDLHLVFPLLFFLWFLYLPLFRELDLESYNTLQDLSFGSVMAMVVFAAATPVLILWLWLGLLVGSLLVIIFILPGLVVLWCCLSRSRQFGGEHQDRVLSVVLRLVSLLRRAGGHESGMHFFVASTVVPVFLLCWANLYFDSVFVSTGLVLIYGAPFLASYLRLPAKLPFALPVLPSCSLWPRAARSHNYATPADDVKAKSEDGDNDADGQAGLNSHGDGRQPDKRPPPPEAFIVRLSVEDAGGCGRVLLRGHVNTAVACLLAIVAGHISFVGSLDVVHPNVIPLAAPLFGVFSVDLNKDYGIYCFAFVSSSAFYIFGFMYLLFEKEGKLPAKSFFAKTRSNLFIASFAVFSLVFLRLALPGTKWKWIMMSPSFVTYSTRLQRVSFALCNWFVLWLTLQFWKYFSEEIRSGGRRTEEATPTFLSSRILFFVFLIHTSWEYCLASLLRLSALGEAIPWLAQIVLLLAGVIGLSYGSSLLLAAYSPEGPGGSDHEKQRWSRSGST